MAIRQTTFTLQSDIGTPVVVLPRSSTAVYRLGNTLEFRHRTGNIQFSVWGNAALIQQRIAEDTPAGAWEIIGARE